MPHKLPDDFQPTDQTKCGRPIGERGKAKAKGETQYCTGKPCKYGHYSNRLVSNGNCIDCSNVRLMVWKSKNQEHVKDYFNIRAKKKYAENPDKFKKYRKELLLKNPEYRERRKAYSRIYDTEYRGKNLLSIRQKGLDWKKRNKAKVNSVSRERYAKKLCAMPKWADKKKILDIYKEAQIKSRETGELHHVDHIVPLVNDKVCGLHVENNLRVISALDNLKKSNRYCENAQPA